MRSVFFTCRRPVVRSQPLGVAASQSRLPPLAQWQIRSELYVICVQRRLGLPIHQASTCDAAAAESLGDELLKNHAYVGVPHAVVEQMVQQEAMRVRLHGPPAAELPYADFFP